MSNSIEKAQFTGYITEAYGSIPKNGCCKLKLDPGRRVLLLQCGKISEEIPFSRLISFLADSEVKTESRGTGFGAAIIRATHDPDKSGEIVSQSVKLTSRKIKWFGYLAIRTEEGEQTLAFAEKMGFGYNTSTAKSYAANGFEHAFRSVVADAKA